MRTVDFVCRVESHKADGNRTLIAERAFPAQSVMEIGVVRSWVRRTFNKALREAGRDVIVNARYRGQMEVSPFHSYAGELSGVNGRTMRVSGEFVK